MYSTVCLKDVMTQRQFDAATARALMRLAYPDDAGRPYIERDNGLYVDESFREVCPPGTIFNWTPADEMDWPGSPNPDTAPFHQSQNQEPLTRSMQPGAWENVTASQYETADSIPETAYRSEALRCCHSARNLLSAWR